MKKHILLLTIVLLLFSSCGKNISDTQRKNYLLGRRLSMENKTEDAIRILSQVYIENPYFAQNAFLYGKVLFYKGETEKALEIWESVFEENPHYADNSKELSRFYISDGELDQAEKVIRKALEWNSGDPVLLTLLSRVYSQRRDYESALNYMIQADSYLETMAEIPLEYAKLLQSYGFYGRAAESVEKAMALSGTESPFTPALIILKERLEHENN